MNWALIVAVYAFGQIYDWPGPDTPPLRGPGARIALDLDRLSAAAAA